MARQFALFFADMRRAIRLIQEFTTGYNAASFPEYLRTYFAVERLLEILSEASRVIPQDIKDRRPETPWARVRGFGNVIRHQYFDIEPDLIWNVVVDELPKLQAAIQTLQESQS